MKKLLVISGEASGDLHGGNVLAELVKLRSDLDMFGTGGEKMRSLGVRLFYHAKDLAVIGIWEVLKKYSFFKGVMDEMTAVLDKEKPDALFLVDYVGFNLRFAAIAKKKGYKVICYVAPQVWSWKKNRIEDIKKYVDELIVLFPFEVDFFRKEGMETHCFGHPLLDIVKPDLDKKTLWKKWSFDPEKKLVSLLPGSRRNEVLKHLPTLFKMAEFLNRQRPDLQFAFPMANTVSKEDVQPFLNQTTADITLVEGDTYNVVAYSDVATVASGTATLETAILQTPMVIFYKTSALTYFIGKYIVHIDRVGLPNIVLGEDIVPEVIHVGFSPENLGKEVLRILDNPAIQNQMKQDLVRVKEKLGAPGAYAKTAEFLSTLI